MRFWRLSNPTHAHIFDGGYGRSNAGRWNLLGQLVTYCSTVPALCILEKLVHVEDTALFPNDLRLVEYDAPDEIAITSKEPDIDLAVGWDSDITVSQSVGSAWYIEKASPILRVPSVVSSAHEPAERNIVINHSHPATRDITLVTATRFSLDERLLRL